MLAKKNRHTMLLNNNEWPIKISNQSSVYYWIDDWNDNDYENLRKVLTNKITFKDDDKIIIFWMKELGVETTWEIFLKYWINFLFEDEGPLLISLNSDDALRFNPDGYLWIGKRY